MIEATYPPSLDSFFAEGLIDEVIREVKSGKEGTVYCCRAAQSIGSGLVAAKVYRSREHRTFHNAATYREGRYAGKRREALAMEQSTRKGMAMKAGMWVNHEAETLRRLGGAGCDVPRLLAAAESALLLEYLFDEEHAASLLTHVTLPAAEARPMFQRLMSNVEEFLRHDLVHGDLSPYNVLYWQHRAIIIDFPQAVDARFNSNAYSLLRRDISNIAGYFARYGVKSDPSRMTDYLWGRYLQAEL